MIRRRAALVSPAVVAVALLCVGCGDGTPEFCEPLERSADLSALSDALEAGDMEVASAEARRLADLSTDAPAEIRSDLEALADAVIDIVDLIADETTGDGDAGEVERQRDELNDRFGDLDQRSDRVSVWALRECGIRLT